MALREPLDDDESASEDEKPGDRPGPVERPDWLVGASEALESEFGRAPDDQGQAPPDLRSATPPPPRPITGSPRVNPYEGFAQSAAGRSFSSNWMEEGYATPPSPSAPASPAHAEDYAPSVPMEHGIEEAHTEEEDTAAPETRAAPGEKARWAPPAPPPKPWWEPLSAQARTPAGLVVVGVAAVVAIVTMLRVLPKDHTVSLSKIRHNVAKYDGQPVKVHGKVGEVYAMGGGYSFYLLQGRDTIVVFTRSRTPVHDEHVAVSGIISTGVLNGVPRQALLEDSR